MENNTVPSINGISNRFTNHVARLAERSDARIRMASIIARGGAILSWANNGPNENEHAELRALKKIAYEVKRGNTIYVARIKFDGSLGMARPCAMCWAHIKQRNIESIVWSTDHQTFEKSHVDDTPHENDSAMPFVSCGMKLPDSYRLIFSGMSLG